MTDITMPKQKRLLSGMQPTGSGALHLGNLEGALRSWVRLQSEYEMFCCIVDWHALTTRSEDTHNIAPACRQVAADYIAAGIDPKKSAIFIQSHVKEHAELHLLLSMITPIGWLERVPTYKEKRELLQERGGSDESGLPSERGGLPDHKTGLAAESSAPKILCPVEAGGFGGEVCLRPCVVGFLDVFIFGSAQVFCRDGMLQFNDVLSASVRVSESGQLERG